MRIETKYKAQKIAPSDKAHCDQGSQGELSGVCAEYQVQ